LGQHIIAQWGLKAAFSDQFPFAVNFHFTINIADMVSDAIQADAHFMSNGQVFIAIGE